MHSGFSHLRNDMTMCIRERVDVRPWSPDLVSDIARVVEIWTDARARFGKDGPYLMGMFSLADVFYAPVSFRFRTYGVSLTGTAAAYQDALAAHTVLAGMGGGSARRNRDRRRRRAARDLSRQDRLSLRGRGRHQPSMMEDAISSWQARIRAAVAARAPLRIRGGGTKDFYGQALAGDVLDTTACEGIVDYDPTELVITVRAGTRLAHVERTMRAEGQMIACEPPRFGEEATVGGFVAAGLSGPRRPYAGAVRDLVLGIRIVDGKGDDLRFGGRVMKNVAGFDVARLMTGALGTLGVISEVSLRCAPMPKAETTRVLQCSADEAIRMTNEWGAKPLPLTATCYHAGRLAVRLSVRPRRWRQASRK
jgi:hypothetical protein